MYSEEIAERKKVAFNSARTPHLFVRVGMKAIFCFFPSFFDIIKYVTKKSGSHSI
jgi:hypothetical protein